VYPGTPNPSSHVCIPGHDRGAVRANPDSITKASSDPLHSLANAIDSSRHRDVEGHCDFVIPEPSCLQLHAFALQSRKTLDLLLDEADPFLLQYLLLGIRSCIALRRVRPAAVARARAPVALAFPLVIYPQIPRHAKHPGAYIFYLYSLPKPAVQAKKGFLGDFFGQRARASQREEITKYRVTQFEKPSLDFLPKPNRAGVWRQNFLPEDEPLAREPASRETQRSPTLHARTGSDAPQPLF